jgi:hypothetical protein
MEGEGILQIGLLSILPKMDAKVSPILVLWPNLMDSCPLLFLLVLGWNLNSSSEKVTSLLLEIDLTLF